MCVMCATLFLIMKFPEVNVQNNGFHFDLFIYYCILFIFSPCYLLLFPCLLTGSLPVPQLFFDFSALVLSCPQTVWYLFLMLFLTLGSLHHWSLLIGHSKPGFLSSELLSGILAQTALWLVAWPGTALVFALPSDPRTSSRLGYRSCAILLSSTIKCPNSSQV